MALDDRLVEFPFTAGVDEQSDGFLVLPPRLKRLRNARFVKSGALQKRPGTTAIARGIVGGGNLSACYQLAGSRGELVACTSDSLYTRSEAVSSWALRDRLPEATAKRSMAVVTPQNMFMPCEAYGNGLRVVVWLQNNVLGTFVRGDIWAAVIDESTGGVVRSPEAIVTGQTSMNPRLLVIGTTAIAIWAKDNGRIQAKTLSLTNPTGWSAATDLCTDAIVSGLNVPYDADVTDSLNGYFTVVYDDNATPPVIRLRKFDASLVMSTSEVSSETVNAAKASFAIIGAADERVWIAYSYTNAGSSYVKYACHNWDDLGEQFAPVTIYSAATLADYATQLGLVRSSATVAQVIASPYANVAGEAIWTRLVNSIGLTIMSRRITYHAPAAFQLSSKPWVVNGRGYILVYAFSRLQGTHFICDTSLDDQTTAGSWPLRPVCTVGPGIASSSVSLLRGESSLSSPAIVSSTEVVAPVQLSSTADTLGRVGIGEVRVDYAAYKRRRAVELGGLLYMSGGVPTYFDGVTVGEVGFLLYPDNITFATSIVGAGMTPGTRSYKVVYAIQDRKGNWHRSAPSPAIQVTTANAGSTNRCTLTIPTLALTLRQDVENGFAPEIYIEIYRTVTSGTVYYRITTDAIAVNLRNSTIQSTTTYQDDAQDTTIQENSLLYTTGPSGRAPLERTVPPSLRAMTVHKRRLWGIADDGAVWYSGEVSSGEAAWFNDSQQFQVEYEPAALGSLDTALVIFGARDGEVSLLFGEGPDPTGGQSDYQTPQRIPSPVGCSNERSIVLAPMGLFFQGTDDQIYLLNRAQQVVKLSGPIEDTLASYPYITSAVVQAEDSLVLFNAQSSDGHASNGVTLVYDFERDVWSVDANANSRAPYAAVIHDGVLKWANIAGYAYAESSSTYLDDGTWVTLLIETGELQPSGMQGYARLRRVVTLFKQETGMNLSVSVFSNRQSGSDQDKTWYQPDLSSFGTGVASQADLHVAYQKGTSFRVVIFDAAPTTSGGTPLTVGTGFGASFKGLTFKVATKRGITKLPAASRA